MYRDGHVGVALLGYSPIVYWLAAADQLTAMALGLVGVVFGCTLPDLDMQISWLKHRGLSHSVVAAGVIGIVYALAGVWLAFQGTVPVATTLLGLLQAAAFAFAIGAGAVILHLLGDVLTPMGIRPWQPWSNREYTLNVTTAANSDANEFLLKSGSAAFVAAVVLGYAGLGIVSSFVDPFLRLLG